MINSQVVPAPAVLNAVQFAEYLDEIDVLYLGDQNFKCLCDEYCKSRINIETYKEKLVENREKELEYKLLSLELEKEILAYIKKLHNSEERNY
jgi:hypothetical protein